MLPPGHAGAGTRHYALWDYPSSAGLVWSPEVYCGRSASDPPAVHAQSTPRAACTPVSSRLAWPLLPRTVHRRCKILWLLRECAIAPVDYGSSPTLALRPSDSPPSRLGAREVGRDPLTHQPTAPLGRRPAPSSSDGQVQPGGSAAADPLLTGQSVSWTALPQ